MSPRQTGELSEVKILARLVEQGIAVSLPFGACHRYDLIVDDGKSLLRAQCKTGRVSKGRVVFKAFNTNGFTGKSKPYYGEADVFLVYCPDNGGYYKVPVDAIGHTVCTLRLEPAKNSQNKLVRWAKDYEF